MRRWYELVWGYVKAQAEAVAAVAVSRGNLSAERLEPVPTADCPCDAGHRHTTRQAARICNELEAHSHGFRAVEILASVYGEPES